MPMDLDFSTYARTITNGKGLIIGWVTYDDTEEGYYCGGFYIQDLYRGRGYGRSMIEQLRKTITKPLMLIGDYPAAFLLHTGCILDDSKWMVMPLK